MAWRSIDGWRRWAAALVLGLFGSVVMPAAPASAVDIVVLYTDDPNEGFNDPTLGTARRAAFDFAANVWADAIGGSITIVVDAAMDPLGGSPSSAVLGQAGSALVARDFTGAPIASTWYPIPLANQLAGQDLAPSTVDIVATFNSDVDNGTVLGSVDWYYGLNASPGSDIDFVAVVLHELGHGLGFFDMISQSTGGWLSGFPDVYGRNLVQSGAPDVPFTSMLDPDRLSALTSGNVYWNGSNVMANNGGMAQIYAPSPYESGSSISHWSTALTPDELMEPFYTGPEHSVGLALPAMKDLGWDVVGATGGSTTTVTATTTSTTTTTLPILDPFVCYKAKTTKKTAKFAALAGVSLVDQFEATSATVVKPTALCNPATTGASSTMDPATHLVGYATKSAKHVAQKTISVTTIFGTTFVNTVRADRLLVPSAKSHTVQPAAPDPATHNVDHYRCYKVKPTKGAPTPYKGQLIVLTDQFAAGRSFDIKKPSLLCNPVDKNGEGIKDNARHVLCYAVKVSKKQPKHQKQLGLYVTNQFGPGQLDTKKENVVCLPALKQRF
jgi:hypothetical protein